MSSETEREIHDQERRFSRTKIIAQDSSLTHYLYLRISITIVVITVARNTKPPNTPKAMTAPRFSLAWWVPLGCSALSTLNGPDGSGTAAPIPAWAWSTPLPDISLSCGWSLPASLSAVDGGIAGLFNPTLGLFDAVSLTEAGCSAALGTFLGGKEVVPVVMTVDALVVVLILGVRYGRTFGVDGRNVAREGTVTLVRGSSEWWIQFAYWVWVWILRSKGVTKPL